MMAPRTHFLRKLLPAHAVLQMRTARWLGTGSGSCHHQQVPSLLSQLVKRTVMQQHPNLTSTGPNLASQIDRSVAHAVARAGAPSADYQINIAAIIAKQISATPVEVAKQLANGLAATDLSTFASVQVSPGGAGFINVTLRDDWLLRRAISTRGSNAKAGVAEGTATGGSPHRILVDFASPNWGKELHVGHLRSGVIGDTLARILAVAPPAAASGGEGAVAGAEAQVERVSHVGDAGLPVALVLAEYSSKGDGNNPLSSSSGLPLPSPGELSKAYETSKKRSSADAAGHGAEVQATLRVLQSALAKVGDAGAQMTEVETSVYVMWRRLGDASRAGYGPLFQRLGVIVTEQGESTYAPATAAVVQELRSTGVAIEDDGAIAIFVDGRDKPPLLIRKRDGGFLYATVDMAALKQRLLAGYARVIYVTDAAQSDHFRQVFAAARLAGWIDASGRNMLVDGHPAVALEHASFGVVTGEGGKKLSSRDGTDLTLSSLLDNGVFAVQAMMAELQQQHQSDAGQALQQAPNAPKEATVSSNSTSAATSSPHGGFLPLGWQSMPASQSASVAESIAMSAIRFYDLAHRRSSSYSFSYARVLALKGHTAAYLLYATTRLNTLKRQIGAALDIQIGNAGGDASDLHAAAWEALACACEDRARLAPVAATSTSAAGAQLTSFTHPAERALALAIIRTPEAVSTAAKTLMPHHLAEHAVEAASKVHEAYTLCRVLPSLDRSVLDAMPAHDWAVAALRLRLFAAADATLRQCFDLLGVQTVERM